MWIYRSPMTQLSDFDGLLCETDALEAYLIETEEEGWHRPALSEEEMTMNQNGEKPEVTIWTQDGCPLCEKVKAIFGEGNYTELAASELISGDRADDEAMAQLAMQDMQLPLVKVDGHWKNLHDLLTRASAAA